MEPGTPVAIVATFIEDRAGRALVRLPNGSKTSIAYRDLAEMLGSVHLSDDPTSGEVVAYCQECETAISGMRRPEVVDEFQAHVRAQHF